ncbi:uncharacterized protein LOC112463248, partial [Temnothorax curvispinosus]|uniref:Uncharacterized protein LOC112463248 n=1 Tax=Temnothorax curvispinosus TaxID=300111 RepID=A0A6J1QS03_9HYME
MEEEGQDALVDYDSDSSFITVIDREAKDKNEETVRKDREAKDKKEMERRGAIPKKNLPKVRENIDVTKAWEENRPVLPIGTKILYEKQEKLVAKMDNSMQMLDKVMTKATEMMENMVEVSCLNLEKEKVKLRRLEVSNKDTQSSVENSKQTVKELEVESKKRKLNEMTVCSAEKDRSLETIKRVIELELNNSNIESPENLSELKVAKRKSLVRDIIINHLDENYHKRILHEKDPKEILKKLRGYKKSEVNVTYASVRAKLYQIKMRKDEK